VLACFCTRRCERLTDKFVTKVALLNILQFILVALCSLNSILLLLGIGRYANPVFQEEAKKQFQCGINQT
jgi:hypothetical protein